MPIKRRILCVWLPYWATTRLRHARLKAGVPKDERLATVTAVRGVRRLAAICSHAEAHGVQVGQTLTQARALCPNLVVADAEPAEDATALAALTQWTTRYTPLAAACPPDTLWLDIAGCAHLCGGEANLAQALVAKLAGWGLQARMAVAGTPRAAYALAHFGPAIIDSSTEKTALAQLPIEALRLDLADTAGLRRLGIKTIADLAHLPRAELTARFGPLTGLRLDQAFGDVDEPIIWPTLPPDWCESERFAEPILTTEACIAVLDRLTRRLCSRLAAQRLGLCQGVAAFRRLDGSVQSIAIAAALPVRDPAYLLRLLCEQLNGLDPGFGIDSVTLAAPSTDTASLQQLDLSGDLAGQTRQRLAQLIDILANRLHPNQLWRMTPRDSHIPERAVQPGAAWSLSQQNLMPPPKGKSPHLICWPDTDAPRPIRLLQHPESIKVTAALPDDPPIQFLWRGALHKVRAATGPERIADEWWSSDASEVRDYYHVEDMRGSRYWMYRVGSAWLLHGLFG